jgi:ABC-2 type transport system permease protein
MRAMIVKEFQELRRDRRTMAMLIVLPLLLLVIFGFAANFTYTTLTATLVGDAATVAQFEPRLPTDVIDVVGTIAAPDSAAADSAAREALQSDSSDIAVVLTADATPTVLIDGSNLFAAQAAKVMVANLGDSVDSQVLFNPDLITSWVMVPAIIGLILTFIGTVVTSIGLVKERQAGTLEQLAVMPLRPVDVIVGKIVPYFVLASVDMIVVTFLGRWIFGVPFVGNPLTFAIGAALFLLVVLGIGVFISTISHTTGQAIQTAIFFLLPQILLSGMIFPLDAMAAGVRWIGYLLPLTYFTKISQGVMLRGAGLDSLWLPLLVLIGMAVAVLSLAVLRFRASITPVRSRAVHHSESEAV